MNKKMNIIIIIIIIVLISISANNAIDSNGTFDDYNARRRLGANDMAVPITSAMIGTIIIIMIIIIIIII